MVREFSRDPYRPSGPGARPDLDVPLGQHQGDGRARPAGRALERGAGRGRDGPALVLHHHPRDGQGGRQSRAHHQRAYQPRHLADRRVRHRGAEAALRPAARLRPGAGRVRPDRARRRQRRRRHRHHRRGQGRPLPAQRLQDLHHPRGCRRDLLGHRAHRAGPRQQGNHQLHRHQGHGRPRPGQVAGNRPRGRPAQDPRRPRRQEGGQDGLARQRHARADLRGRRGAQGERAGAGRATASSTSSRRSTRAASGSPPCRSASPRGPTRRRSGTRASGSSSAARSGASRA